MVKIARKKVAELQIVFLLRFFFRLKTIDDGADEGKHEAEKERPPKTFYIKSRNETTREHDKSSVDNKGKKAER